MVWLCTEDSLYMFLMLWATSLIYTVLWAASSPIYMIWHSHGNYCNCQHGKILVAYLMHFNLEVSTAFLLGAKCRQSSWSLQWGVTEHSTVCMEGADRSTLCLLKVSKHTSCFFQVSVLQSFVKCHWQMVPRKKALRIITSLVSVFTWVLARECCCLRVCREQLTGEGSTHKNSPLPGSLLSLLLSKEATSHKMSLKHQSLNKGHTKCISYIEDLSKRGKKKVKRWDKNNLL